MISYFEEQLAIISHCFNVFPDNDFTRLVDQCIQTFETGGKIIASGLGKNVPVCEKFVGTMNSFGLDARFLHTNTAIHGDLGMINKKDLVLLLSKSGNTAESVLLAEHLYKRGSKTWLLTFTENSKTSLLVDDKLILVLKDEGDLWNISPNNSTVVYMIVLQGLAMHIAKIRNIKIHDFQINHPGGGIGEKLLSLTEKDLRRHEA